MTLPNAHPWSELAQENTDAFWVSPLPGRKAATFVSFWIFWIFYNLVTIKISRISNPLTIKILTKLACNLHGYPRRRPNIDPKRSKGVNNEICATNARIKQCKLGDQAGIQLVARHGRIGGIHGNSVAAVTNIRRRPHRAGGG